MEKKQTYISIIRITMLLAFFSFVLIYQGTAHASNPSAIAVYGQNGSFTSNGANNGGVSANSISFVSDITTDSSGNLYVADTNNNRVLYYPKGSTTATRVYGQNGSFTSTNTSCSATGLNAPRSVQVDSNNDVYIADSGNTRILYYPSGSTTATVVYGQGGSFTSCVRNYDGVSADSLNYGTGADLDSHGNLYATDYNNNRVLFFPAGQTTATRVYGQSGSFTSSNANHGSLSADSLNIPRSVAIDASDNVYIADGGNNRILYYPAGSTTATVVYGQGGSFTYNGANNGGVSANSLNDPKVVQLDSAGNLYTSDFSNNRVLYYPAGSTTATVVYGQGGSFTSNGANNGGVSANSLNIPVGIALDPVGNLYVGDQSNNRVLEFPSQSESLVATTEPPASIQINSPFTTAFSLENNGTVDTSFTGPVSISIQSGSGAAGATLSGTTTVNAVSGVASFTNLSIDTISTGYILSASSSGYIPGATTPFDITGSLSESITASPSVSVILQAADQIKTTTLGIEVTDTTSTNNGWHLNLTSTQFKDTNGDTLSQSATKITGVTPVCQPSCTLPINAVTYPVTVPAQSTPPTAVKVYNAGPNSGENSTQLTASLSISIPANTMTGTYSSTFIITIISGP